MGFGWLAVGCLFAFLLSGFLVIKEVIRGEQVLSAGTERLTQRWKDKLSPTLHQCLSLVHLHHAFCCYVKDTWY